MGGASSNGGINESGVNGLGGGVNGLGSNGLTQLGEGGSSNGNGEEDPEKAGDTTAAQSVGGGRQLGDARVQQVWPTEKSPQIEKQISSEIRSEEHSDQHGSCKSTTATRSEVQETGGR